MEVITIEAGAFKRLEGMIESMLTTTKQLAEENKSLKDNRLMSMSEVCKYTGYGPSWILKYKAEIGYSQVGVKDLKFYKSDIDAFFKNSNHYIKTK